MVREGLESAIPNSHRASICPFVIPIPSVVMEESAFLPGPSREIKMNYGQCADGQVALGRQIF
jgi:hypothetical protein